MPLGGKVAIIVTRKGNKYSWKSFCNAVYDKNITFYIKTFLEVAGIVY